MPCVLPCSCTWEVLYSRKKLLVRFFKCIKNTLLWKEDRIWMNWLLWLGQFANNWDSKVKIFKLRNQIGSKTHQRLKPFTLWKKNKKESNLNLLLKRNLKKLLKNLNLLKSNWNKQSNNLKYTRNFQSLYLFIKPNKASLKIMSLLNKNQKHNKMIQPRR